MLYAVGEHSGIYCIEDIGEARAYFVAEPEPALIDTGGPGQGDNVLRALASLGVRPLDIRRIILTHHHLENTGALWELHKRTGAKICAHPLDADYITGKRARRHRGAGLNRAYEFAAARLRGMEPRPVPVSVALQDGGEIAGLRVIHTPGHTAGHICLLRGEALFSGDLVEASAGGFSETAHELSDDVATSRRSISRVARYEIRAVLPSHRPPYVFGAGERLRELAGRLAAETGDWSDEGR